MEKATFTEPPTETAPEAERYEFEHEETKYVEKRERLSQAKQELEAVIASAAEDYFSSMEEQEDTLERIRQNPEAILSSSEKPFMKKIARAMMNVDALTKEVEEATQRMLELQSDKQLHAALAKVSELESKVIELEAKANKAESKVTKLNAKVNAMDETLKKQEEMMNEQQEHYLSLIQQQRAYMDSKVEALSKHLAEQAKQAEDMKQQFAEWMKRLEDKPKGLLSFGGKGAAK